jgi:hypothetical protein
MSTKFPIKIGKSGSANMRFFKAKRNTLFTVKSENYVPPIVSNNFLLLETGDYLLLESGDRIIL